MARQPALVRYATNYFSPARQAKEKRATYTYSNVALWSADHGPKAQPFGWAFSARRVQEQGHAT
jgi:hypothetical protein